MNYNYKDTDPQETQEWIESIEDALEQHGYERTRFLLENLIDFAQSKGARLPFNTETPFINTILIYYMGSSPTICAHLIINCII